jgi:hypothetical protein
MRQRVIADPVTGRMRLAHQRGSAGIGELVADDEEGRCDALAREEIEHAGGDAGGRPIVEGERHVLGQKSGLRGVRRSIARVAKHT